MTIGELLAKIEEHKAKGEIDDETTVILASYDEGTAKVVYLRSAEDNVFQLS